jgi:hypothetical protein
MTQISVAHASKSGRTGFQRPWGELLNGRYGETVIRAEETDQITTAPLADPRLGLQPRHHVG